ncbi:MAG: STAS domain-containing protein [Phycisphaerae bacterium]|nr:STAS domain-containing protein [Phycisphaerae bacterium]
MTTDWSENILITELADEPALSDELATLIQRFVETEDGRVPHVVLNFGAVTYVNSSNLAQMLRLRKRLGECGRRVTLCSVADQVRSVISITGLDKVLAISPDPLTALARLQIGEGGEREPAP